MALSHLPVERAGTQAIPRLLEPEHHVLGKAAPVVARFLLPAFFPLGGDLGQDAIAGISFPKGRRRHAAGSLPWRTVR